MRGSLRFGSVASNGLQSFARVIRHQTVFSANAGIGKTLQARRRFAENFHRRRIGRGGVCKPALRHIDGRDHIPTFAVLGVISEPRFNFCNQIIGRLHRPAAATRSLSGMPGIPGAPNDIYSATLASGNASVVAKVDRFKKPV